MAKVEISVNSQFSAAKEIKQLKDDFATILDQQIQIALGEIVKKANQGQGTDGALAGYAQSYAEVKSASGRNAQVNLTWSGQMLRSLITKVEKVATGIEATIFVGNNARAQIRRPKKPRKPAKIPKNSELIRYTEAGGKNRPPRKFFALSAQQIDKIINALQR